jgi:hypothetical protein
MHSVIQESARKTEVLVKDAKEEEKGAATKKVKNNKIYRNSIIQKYRRKSFL